MLALALAQPAHADEPRAGKRYDGKSATGQWIYLQVAKDGSRLSRYHFSIRTPCNDSGRPIQGLAHPGEGPARIRDGRFTYTSPWEPLRQRRKGGGPAAGRAKFTFTGRFADDGLAVRGVLSATFRGSGLRCKNEDVSFRVDLDGTPRAPFRSRNVATGLYGVTGHRIRQATLRPFLPARVVSLRYRWIATCGGGGSVTLGNAFTVDLHGARFRRSGRLRYRLNDGFRIVQSYRFRGRLVYDGAYRVRGVLSIGGTIYKGNERADTCPTRTRAFRGTFRKGPKDPAGERPDRAP